MQYWRLLGGAMISLALAAGPSSALGASSTGEAAATTTSTTSVSTAGITAMEGTREKEKEKEGEPPIAVKGVEGDYLRAMHTQIHWRWVHKFIEDTLGPLPPHDPLNNPSLEAEVLFTVRWDGSTAEVTLSRSSGNKEFDKAAVAAVRGNGHYAVPPLQVFGDDGVAHFRWALARDHRQCSDAEVRRREASLDEALPRLFVQGRKKEALLRAVRNMREGDGNAMSTFARAYLGLRFSDPIVDAHAAAALALAGDRRQVERLRPALAHPETAVLAASALAALKVDICSFEQPALEGKDAEAASQAARVLRDGRIELPETSPCVAALAARVKDEGAPAAVRAEMLRTLAVVNPSSAHRMLALTLADPAPEMRAAAAIGIARPGGGRPTLYRLEPLLKDRSPEVRAAAAAGLVRGVGDMSFEYLRPVFKQNDTAAMLAMAPELGRQSSPASADLLAKILKRDTPELKKAVMDALAMRRDPPARALFKPMVEAVKRDIRASSEARLLAYANADLDEILPLALDPVLGPLAYRALLRAHRTDEAIDWLVTAFDRLPPETLVDAFATWLAAAPTRMAATGARE